MYRRTEGDEDPSQAPENSSGFLVVVVVIISFFRLVVCRVLSSDFENAVERVERPKFEMAPNFLVTVFWFSPLFLVVRGFSLIRAYAVPLR